MQPIAVWMQDDIYRDFSIGKSLTIILKTKGCSHRKCVFCSYYLDSANEEVSKEDLIKQFNYAINKYNDKIKNLKDFSVKIFTSGSFLDDNEVPKEVREYIYKKLSEFKNLKELAIESRAEYITDKKLEEIRKYLDVNVEIGLGVETSNEELREILGKDLKNEDIDRVLNLSKKFDIGIKAYLLIKPPFLTEKSAIKDAIKSAEFCIKKGFSRVSFCPLTVHKDTLVEKLWKKKQYRPPFLWSIIEIIKYLKEKYPNYLIMVDTAGIPSKRGAHNNCECDYKIKNLLERYTITQNVEILNIDCKCKKVWKEFLKVETLPIQESVLLEPLH
ncbi:archaeosine biosynthesis radical SAM protein RaSEA [Methanocaldococcus indicus]|uniref:archaeosine biosynthesis radical SAM protein RaSEA n=1 Tax=Methanocaldococcus indicus TaxID=213231 RepID=UPI003C6CD5DE